MERIVARLPKSGQSTIGSAMMKASMSLVFGIAASIAVLIATPVAAQPWRLDNPYGWIDRFKAESARRDLQAKQEEAGRSGLEVAPERLKARGAKAEQRAAEARKRYAEDKQRAAEARRRAIEATATAKQGATEAERRAAVPEPEKRELEARQRERPEEERFATLVLTLLQRDGIYQLGKQVGTVELPQIDESKSTVFFQRIVGAMDLNKDREFEYQKYVLRIRGELGETSSDLSGQRSRALFGVLCDIVGPASTSSISR
jgi:hypothetical protein